MSETRCNGALSQRETYSKNKWTQIPKAALLYFLIVFGAGSLLGPIRILFVVPRIGERVAEC